MDHEDKMRAMVLCAGYGTRLGDLTRKLPKPMLPLRGRPLLEYIFHNLACHDFNEIVVNLHYMPDVIRDYFGNGSHLGIVLTYSYEPEILGTAGAVKKLEHFFRREDAFLVQYGDVVTDQNFTAMLNFHRKHQALATLLLHQRAQSNSIVNLDRDGRIVGFLERPNEDARRGAESSWANSGVCICDAEFLNEIPANVSCDLPKDIFPKLVAGGRLYGFPLSGYRCAIDSPDRLAEANSALRDGQCSIELPQKVQ